MLETPPKRVRAGFSLAIVTLVVIFGSLVLSALDPLHVYLSIILLGFGVLGVVLLLCDRRKTPATVVPTDQIQDGAVTESEHPLAFLGRTGYWGWVVIVSAAFTFFV